MKNDKIKWLLCISTVIAIFIAQLFASKVGGITANLVSYERIDYHNLYA